jgi:hypothetical protein
MDQNEMMAESIRYNWDRHESTLIDHAAKIKALEESNRQLALVDERLKEDIQNLRDMVKDGFADSRARDAENGVILSRIEGEAFRSVPGTLANQISIHGLVWQVIGVVSSIAVGILLVYTHIS